jgi:hypothetical protein
LFRLASVWCVRFSPFATPEPPLFGQFSIHKADFEGRLRVSD